MYQMMEDWGKEGSFYRDGIIDCNEDSMAWPYIVFVSLLLLLGGAFIGSVITATTSTTIVKEKYCQRYTDTQAYLSCINKPIQEIYSLMEKR